LSIYNITFFNEQIGRVKFTKDQRTIYQRPTNHLLSNLARFDNKCKHCKCGIVDGKNYHIDHITTLAGAGTNDE
jgi:hypothetical protein